MQESVHYGVSNRRLDRALKAHQDAGGSPLCDGRGRHEPGNETKKEVAAKTRHT